jgi:hypothetical protein
VWDNSNTDKSGNDQTSKILWATEIFNQDLKQIHAIIIHYAVTTGHPISGQNTTSTAQGITRPRVLMPRDIL